MASSSRSVPTPSTLAVYSARSKEIWGKGGRDRGGKGKGGEGREVEEKECGRGRERVRRRNTVFGLLGTHAIHSVEPA